MLGTMPAESMQRRSSSPEAQCRDLAAAARMELRVMQLACSRLSGNQTETQKAQYLQD